jgi:Glutaredoxin-like domain (DUF836)
VARLRLLSRPDCGLCEEFRSALEHLGSSVELPAIEVVDVDSDPVLARRFGLDVPVLLLDEARVCQHHLDPEELLRLLRPR